MKRTYKSITDQQSSKEKSPHYYQLDRNLDNAKQSNTRDINNKHVSDLIDQYGGKTRTGGIENDHRVPEYYKGKEGYEARKVCDNFDLTYHLATATSYVHITSMTLQQKILLKQQLIQSLNLKKLKETLNYFFIG